MNDRMFDNPVYVKDGESLIREIAGIDDAIDFMYEWPRHRRGPIFDTAYRACRSALDDYPMAAAKAAFVGFAKSANIFHELAAPLPWPMVKGGESGGLTA